MKALTIHLEILNFKTNTDNELDHDNLTTCPGLYLKDETNTGEVQNHSSQIKEVDCRTSQPQRKESSYENTCSVTNGLLTMGINTDRCCTEET